jgi:hypothetical protein
MSFKRMAESEEIANLAVFCNRREPFILTSAAASSTPTKEGSRATELEIYAN